MQINLCNKIDVWVCKNKIKLFSKTRQWYSNISEVRSPYGDSHTHTRTHTHTHTHAHTHTKNGNLHHMPISTLSSRSYRWWRVTRITEIPFIYRNTPRNCRSLSDAKLKNRNLTPQGLSPFWVRSVLYYL